MFYVEEEIAVNLICPRCKTKFVDPRIIVPCLETLCAHCIATLTDENNNEITCHFCADRKHAIPEDGFGSNKIVAKMLSIKADEVNRSPNAEALKQKVNHIHNLRREFVSKCENSISVIKDYCQAVKSRLDSFVEAKKRDLDKARDEFATEIDSYETECLANWKKWNDKMFLERLHEINTFVRDCSEYLKTFRIDENVVSEKRRGAGTHAAELEKLLRQLKGAQFNGKLMKFKESELNSKLIGSFEFEHLEMPQRANNLSKKNV
jgi:hypothetical protein